MSRNLKKYLRPQIKVKGRVLCNTEKEDLNFIILILRNIMPPKKKKASGDAGKGEKIFKNLCAVCHSMTGHGTGPSLKGAHGAAPASKEGFTYS